MHHITRCAAVAVALLSLLPVSHLGAQNGPRTIVAVFPHGDDEGSVAPVLARYAREGVRVYLIVTTDGAQGGAHTSIPRGPELARVRADETRCAAEALGIQPPILLDFPDAKLGDYTDDPTRLFRLTQEIYQHLQPLSPDALISWGPDGATGHPDHRLTSDIVTQLVRSGAPGIPQHLFYASLPASGMLAINPGRGVPPYLIPQAKYFTVHVPFTEKDFDAARRAMSCHRTQFTEDVVQRVVDAARSEWKGALPLVPFVATDAGTVLLR